MAQIIHPTITEPEQYRGLDWVFEYTNNDGKLTTWNCGQAASATFLTFHGCMDPVLAASNMTSLEQQHPPDQCAGYFGTGRRRVERILRAFRINPTEIAGKEGIIQQLDRRNPVILMVGVSSGKLFGFDLPGGHWVVAYGYDQRHIYLTNWGSMTWDELREGWNTFTCRWIRMNGRGLAKDF